MTVTPVNDPPVADDDGDTTNQGIPVTIDVVAGDSDIDGSVVASTAQIVSGPTNGTVANNGDGTFTYTPNVGPFLTDSFTYQVWDDSGDPSNVATVTITIRQPDLDIIKDALPDSAAPGEDVQFFIYVINNGPGIAFSALCLGHPGELLPLGRISGGRRSGGLGRRGGPRPYAEGPSGSGAGSWLRQHQSGRGVGTEREHGERHRRGDNSAAAAVDEFFP